MENICQIGYVGFINDVLNMIVGSSPEKLFNVVHQKSRAVNEHDLISILLSGFLAKIALVRPIVPCIALNRPEHIALF